MEQTYRRTPLPKIIVSRCLGFAACRFDGQMIHNDFIEKLKGHAEFITVCPEVEIGLPVPRPPLFLVGRDEKLELLQPDTGLDLTEEMDSFIDRFLKTLAGQEIKAIILKSRSPACGLEDAKVYTRNGQSLNLVAGNGTGFWAKALEEKYPDIPIRNELYFLDKTNRQDFLKYLFAQSAGK